MSKAYPKLLCILTAIPLLAGETELAQKLSLRDAITLSLQNNLQVKLAKESVAYAKAGALGAAGAFDWAFGIRAAESKAVSSSFSTAYSNAVPAQVDSTSWSRSATASLSRAIEWGGNFSINYTPTYSYTMGDVVNSSGPNSFFRTYAPYAGSASVTYSQSLLRGFGTTAGQRDLLVARLGAKAADYTFQTSLIGLVAGTESSYWDMVYAQRNLANKKLSLELAKKQLDENRQRVSLGAMAAIEVTGSEAAVAQREQEIIVAEARFLNARDALGRILFSTNKDQDLPAFELTDSPVVVPTEIGEKDAIRRALANRTELKGASLDVESKKILEDAAANRALPQLDVSLGYYGSADSHASLGPVRDDLFHNRNPGYNLSVNFSVPIANRSARGALGQAKANRRSSELTLKDLENGIVLEVRTALRNVQAAEKSVVAAEKTRAFREKDLESERMKYEHGMTTNFIVLQKQNDLDTANDAETLARVAYVKSRTDLEKAIGNLLTARGIRLE